MIGQLALLAVAAVVAPLLAKATGRLAVPGVVIEILLGVLLGPAVLDLVTPSTIITYFANIGLALLMFLAGYEFEVARLSGRPLLLAGGSWLTSVALAAVVGLALLAAGQRHGNIVTGLALTTTALGTLLPVVRDSGALRSAFGTHLLAVGSIGEFGPIVLIALALSGKSALLTVGLFAGFAVLAVALGLAARRPWGQHVRSQLRHGLHASSQLPVRMAMLLMVALVFAATKLGLDVLLGAFAAGAIVRLAVTGSEETLDTQIFHGKLEAIGFGFLVPIFFVVSGVRLDLDAFGRHPLALLAIPAFFALLLVARGAPTWLWYRSVLPVRHCEALAVFSATGLPLIVVVTTIGQDAGYVTAQRAAALVCAGVLSVLVLPAVGLRLLTG